MVDFTKIVALLDVGIPVEGIYLLSKIIAAGVGYLVNKSNEEYASELGISKPRVSMLIGKLHDAGVLHRVGPRAVFINPGYLFRGTPEAQNRAVEEWCKLRMERLNKPKELS